MSPLSNLKRPYVWPLLLLIVANLLLLTEATSLRFLAALILLAFLPGWVWIQAFFKSPVDLIERLTLAVGLSLALSILGTM